MDATSLIMWLAALAALALLVLLGLVSEVVLSRRRDAAMRVMKSLVFFAVVLLALAPCVVALASEAGAGLVFGLFFYVVFFGLFCYYLGKRVGTAHGKRHMSELIGLETLESLEDTQDRLFESRMRFKTRAEVVNSIGEMAKAQEAERLEAEKRAVRSARPAAEIDLSRREDDIDKRQ